MLMITKHRYLLFAALIFIAASLTQIKLDQNQLNDTYLNFENGKVIFKHSINTQYFQNGDIITHINEIPVLVNGLNTVMQTDDGEIIVPLVDISGHGGYKYVGFISIKRVIPESINIERRNKSGSIAKHEYIIGDPKPKKVSFTLTALLSYNLQVIGQYSDLLLIYLGGHRRCSDSTSATATRR